MSGRHRKPRHLEYHVCLCGRRITLDLDKFDEVYSGAGFWSLFDVEPDFGGLPNQVLEILEEAVEKHEAECLAGQDIAA